MRKPALIVTAALGIALAGALPGCGSQEQSVKAPTYPELRAKLAGSPAPLAATHRQMGKVLEGGSDSLKRAIASLRGYPVVINAWASWCGPCRYEFPLLGQASLARGKEVAFLGVASRDQASSAASFLKRNPVGYPSWADPDGKVSQSIGVGVGLPATVFYDRTGRRSYIHQGPYDSVKDLEADIERYANGP
ncbi:MAG: TlpA disulfide reductase family protein [Actinomycetes bacterium]